MANIATWCIISAGGSSCSHGASNARPPTRRPAGARPDANCTRSLMGCPWMPPPYFCAKPARASMPSAH
eukprot:4877815-Pyramimonas_sp.AAC.1